MAIGWVRAYSEENKSVKTSVPYFQRAQRATFRSKFKTTLRKTKSNTANILSNLRWGDVLELPDGLSDAEWTKVEFKKKTGFVLSEHLVEIAFVKKKNGSSKKSFLASMDYKSFDSETHIESPAVKELIWGDLVQITNRGPQRCDVRVRGVDGKMNTKDLTGKPLLEVYFIDVGQGDGVLVRTPDMKHLLIDGGLQRSKQQTGKNAADLVDWKFFFDYGDFRVRLDSMMASHSDSDHYGGLHDLIRETELADRELDCLGVDVDIFHHPGLSRWTPDENAVPPHSDGLGPKLNNGFIRLLDDRKDAEGALEKDAPERLSGPWKWFIRDILENSKKTKVERVILAREDLQSGKSLPNLWKPAENCAIKVLAPVSYKESGKIALKDLGAKGKNTNGHSICLMLNYHKARILLTGDLNTKSMNWLEECYDDRVAAFRCDVAKACHHGSDDISYRFLEAINAAATVISSGDAEGHAHPRPEIVGASACAGHKFVDRKIDKLVTPLVYMTEIERSVTLGAINRIDIKSMSTEDGDVDGVVLGRPIDEIEARGFLSPDDRDGLKGKSKTSEKNKIIKQAKKDVIEFFEDTASKTTRGDIRVDVNLSVPLGPVDRKNDSKRLWRSRLMHKTHYGLVNVRTDGHTIMCATMDETEEDWIIHSFPARFPDTA